MAEHNDLGKEGEELAAAFLRNLGYRIEAMNWRGGRDELDIVARDGPFLVIAEVKTRKTSAFGEPEVFVTRAKQKNLIRCANEYIRKFNFMGETRFDIVSVIITPSQNHITHIKDAFYPVL